MKPKKIQGSKFKKMSIFLISALIMAITGFGSTAEAVYSLPADRAITWQGNVGVEGGIPNRTAQTDCTQAPYYGNIQSCLNGIPSGTVAYVPAGTYSIGATLNIPANKTLRGAGMDKTILTNTSLHIGSGYTDIRYGAIGIQSGYTKGSTQLTLNDTSGISPGSFIYIVEFDDPTIPVTSQGLGNCFFCGPYPGGTNQDRQQTVKVTAVSGNTITLAQPMYFTFHSGNSPVVVPTSSNFVQFAGVEDLTLDNSNGWVTGSRARNIVFQGTANCWVKDVKINTCAGRCVELYLDGYRDEIRDNYFTNCVDQYDSDQCYGVFVNTVSAALVENNIFDNTANGVVLESATGNVAAYNYMHGVHRSEQNGTWFWPDSWTHGAHCQANLWEGNDENSIEWDVYWGSNSHNVQFRNRATSKDPTVSYGAVQQVGALITSFINHYTTDVGNVLGTAGWNDTYEIFNQQGWYSKPIYSTGASGNDSAAFTTTLRHMNYDYFTNSVHLCSDAGEPGCQGGTNDTSLPVSLYLASKPAWFASLMWPPIGPDVPGFVTDIPAKVRYNGGTVPPSTHTVTPSAGPNGTISPNTPQTINDGATTTFTVTANSGYTASVGGTCGGSLTGTVYTTNPITADCTVTATFTPIVTHTVSPSAGANGTISPSTPQTINDGSTTTFTVTANTGYTGSVGGTCGGALAGTVYTTNPITADCTVIASFALPVTHTVAPSAGPNGTISPNTLQTINDGTTTTFTVTANTGYTASVGGTCGGTLNGTVYTTNPITADCTVAASFSLSSSDQNHYDFTYPDRSSFSAAGWDFLATTVTGGSRNTEQTSGAVVSYDQSAHPGVLRIPVDSGDLWGSLNNSRDSLFRNLPANWTSITLKLNFAPTQDYQQAGLLAYQDDDNYVQVTRAYNGYNGGQLVQFVREINGSPTTLTSVTETAISNLYLRLNRDPVTDTITGYYSVNGSNWTYLGSVTQSLTSPRLAIFVGASPSGFPNADLLWVEITSSPHYDFNYPDRSSFIAAGWDFLAKTATGGSRNTEQTSGAVVSYDQSAHPGVLRIPVDSGDLWGSLNNSRNSLFRNLPANWTSITLKLNFAPTQNFQQAGILAYQGDDNYIQVTRVFNGGQLVEFVKEANGSPSLVNSVSETATSDLYLRLNRDPATEAITGYYSVNGSNWTYLGSVTQALTNPRLAIFGGASPGGFPNADLSWVEINLASQ